MKPYNISRESKFPKLQDVVNILPQKSTVIALTIPVGTLKFSEIVKLKWALTLKPYTGGT